MKIIIKDNVSKLYQSEVSFLPVRTYSKQTKIAPLASHAAYFTLSFIKNTTCSIF